MDGIGKTIYPLRYSIKKFVGLFDCLKNQMN